MRSNSKVEVTESKNVGSNGKILSQKNLMWYIKALVLTVEKLLARLKFQTNLRNDWMTEWQTGQKYFWSREHNLWHKYKNNDKFIKHLKKFKVVCGSFDETFFVHYNPHLNGVWRNLKVGNADNDIGLQRRTENDILSIWSTVSFLLRWSEGLLMYGLLFVHLLSSYRGNNVGVFSRPELTED